MRHLWLLINREDRETKQGHWVADWVLKMTKWVIFSDCQTSKRWKANWTSNVKRHRAERHTECVCICTQGNQIPAGDQLDKMYVDAVARLDLAQSSPNVARLAQLWVDLQKNMDGELACTMCTCTTFHFYFAELEGEALQTIWKRLRVWEARMCSTQPCCAPVCTSHILFAIQFCVLCNVCDLLQWYNTIIFFILVQRTYKEPFIVRKTKPTDIEWKWTFNSIM